MISLIEISNWFLDIPVWQIIVILFFPITIDYLRTLGYIIILEVTRERRNVQKTKMRSYFKVHDKKISILIPAYNEELSIKECIDCALACFYPNKEIIVIDDASTDRTYEIAKEFTKDNSIKLLRLEHGGSKANALNYGYTYSTGEYVITMDADTRLKRYSLEKIIRKFDDPKTIAMSGNVMVSYGDDHIVNLLTKIQNYEYALVGEISKRVFAKFNTLLVLSGAFAIFKREVFGHGGGFSTDTITEDFDKSMAAQKMNQIIDFGEKSYAESFCPNSWHIWIKQRNRWAYGALQTLLKNRDVLYSRKYRFSLRLATLDLGFTDVSFSIISVFSFLAFLVFGIFPKIIQGEIIPYVQNIGSILMLMFGIYIISDFLLFFYARHLSDYPQPIRMIYLIPIMIFVYRPLLKIVTVRAYLKVIFKKKIQW